LQIDKTTAQHVPYPTHKIPKLIDKAGGRRVKLRETMREIQRRQEENRRLILTRYFGFGRPIFGFNRNSPTIWISSAGPAHRHFKKCVAYKKKIEKKPRVSRDINFIIFHRFLFRFSLSNSNPLSYTNKSNFTGVFYCQFSIDFKKKRQKIVIELSVYVLWYPKGEFINCGSNFHEILNSEKFCGLKKSVQIWKKIIN
jgi:hypothetical protein